MVDLNKNFLTANPSLLERLQDDEPVTGYNYNRVVDALNGNYLGTTYIAHNDTYVNTENMDPANGFNGRLFYVIPSNMIAIQSAFLSMKFLNYRTYSTITLSATGAGSSHLHSTGGETGHTHEMLAQGGVLGNGALQVYTDGSGNVVSVTTNNGSGPAQYNTYAGSGHTHNNTGGEASHTHSVSGSTIVGIAEDTSPTNLTVLFDGVDKTIALGGPFNTDVVELNITSFINQAKGAWHKIEFGGSQRGQLQMHLRLNLLVVTPA